MPTRSPRSPPRARGGTVPTARALWLGLAAVGFFATGASTSSIPLMGLGALVVTALSAAFFVAALTRAELSKVALALSTGTGEGALTPVTLRTSLERPGELTVTLSQLPPGVALGAFRLVPETTSPVNLVASVPTTPDHPDRLLQRTFDVVSHRLGDGFLHGFGLVAEVALGLFCVSTRARAELVISALPARIISGPPHLPATRAVNESQAELVMRDKRGFGMEIRELRDFLPGDPFKHIAWSASARRGKLIAREFENDMQWSVWLCLDVSPSMWWGPAGSSRLDHALTIACELARLLSSGREKVGLVIHDHTCRLVIEPGRGPLHFNRLLSALLEAPHLVFEDMTEVTDRELVERVARWWLVQRQRSFPARPRRVEPPLPGSWPRQPGPADNRPLPRQSPHDEEALVEACREALSHSRRRRPVIADTAWAVDPTRAVLRAFCRRFGIELARDPNPRPGGQAHGLEAVLGAVLAPQSGKKSSAHTIVSLSDLHTADDVDALRRVALASRRHRHGLVFIQPIGERGAMPPPRQTQIASRHKDGRPGGAPRAELLTRALLEVQELRAEETLRTAQALLRPAGATFVQVAPTDPLARVLTRLAAPG